MSSLFTSFFLAGFECSSHRRKDGVRLDVIAATRHDALAAEDYALCVSHGLRTVRDGVRWHLIETSPGVYDWSSWLPMLRAARDAGVRVIWDVFHYGAPDELVARPSQFIDRYSKFAAELTRVHKAECDEPPLLCPINEISFLAWAGGEVGYFPPFHHGRGDALKRQLVRAAVAGIEAVRAVDSRAKFLWAEPLINIISNEHTPESRAAAEGYRTAQFQAYDMLTGRLAPELGGRPDYVDAVGLNFYPHNQWRHMGSFIPMGHHDYRPLADMLLEVQERFGKPMFVAETGAEGSCRPAWLHYVCDEVRAAMARGADIQGICLYPVTAYPGWDDERHCDAGLFSVPDETGRRTPFAPLAAELERQKAIFASELAVV